MRIRKKLLYYLLGILVILVVLVFGPLRVVGDRERPVSVLWSIVHLSKDLLWQSSSMDAFDAGFSPWFYTLLPLVCAVPSVADLHGELASRFYMAVELRRGKYRYVYSRFLRASASGALMAAAAVFFYAVFVCILFPLNPVGITIWGCEEITAGGQACHIWWKLFYVAMYGMTMSVLASFFVFLYPNLYVDLSALFVVSNLARHTAGLGELWFPLVMLAGLAVFYALMWKWRSETI